MAVALLAAPLLLVAALALPAAPAEAAFPGDNGRIAFDRDSVDVDDDGDIYSIKPDGTGQAPIFAGPLDDDKPAYSPNGKKVAFSSDGNTATNPEGDPEIYTINTDGTGLTNVTDNADAFEFEPNWSSTNKIVFERLDFIDFSSDIYTINSDGTGLTNVTNSDRDEFSPNFSPEGSKIAYASSPPGFEGENEIFTINSDGSGAPNQVTETNGQVGDPDGSNDDNTEPAFSPDGRRSRTRATWRAELTKTLTTSTS